MKQMIYYIISNRVMLNGTKDENKKYKKC
jgi:hypothetical protein